MLISGVILTPLRIIGDERGSVMHVLRDDSDGYGGFGEAYFSTVRPGVVKAWKKHTRMTMNIAVPVGSVTFVLYDDRPSSPTRGMLNSFTLGPADYRRLTVPPGLWNGFRGDAPGESLLINIADIGHDPAEVERLPPDSAMIPHRW